MDMADRAFLLLVNLLLPVFSLFPPTFSTTNGKSQFTCILSKTTYLKKLVTCLVFFLNSLQLREPDKWIRATLMKNSTLLLENQD